MKTYTLIPQTSVNYSLKVELGHFGAYRASVALFVEDGDRLKACFWAYVGFGIPGGYHGFGWRAPA